LSQVVAAANGAGGFEAPLWNAPCPAPHIANAADASMVGWCKLILLKR
jgi:hypothetical protein